MKLGDLVKVTPRCEGDLGCLEAGTAGIITQLMPTSTRIDRVVQILVDGRRIWITRNRLEIVQKHA